MAQWIRHLTTNQGIPGSSPGRVDFFFSTCSSFLSHSQSHFSVQYSKPNVLATEILRLDCIEGCIFTPCHRKAQ